jgi:hypothetical protein
MSTGNSQVCNISHNHICVACGQVLAKEALPLRASSHMCAHFVPLCTRCHLKFVGHALTKAQPYQHSHVELHLLWTVETPS